MHRRQVLTTILLVVICVIAVAAAVSAVVLQGDVGAAVIAAVALLALAQLIAYLSRSGARREAFESLSDLMAASDALTRDLAIVRNRIDRLEARFAKDAEKTSSQVNRQIAALNDTLADMRGDDRPQRSSDQTGTSRRPAMASAEPSLLGEAASGMHQLFLEPIVRLASNSTAYYRATLDFEPDVMRPGKSGPAMAGGLELFERVAPVLRRFQDRGRAIGVFCPLTAAALADDGFIARLVRFVEANSDIAGALVIDISQDQLALLDERGQKGLAHLAQLGATFVLSQCRLNVPDLDALKQLGFSFVDADVDLLIDAKRHAPCPAADVIAEARRLDLSIIAANVAKLSEVAWIEDSFPLARGPHFSPPRPVRHDITSHESFSAAA